MIFIRLQDKKTKEESGEINIEDLIYVREDIQFVFGLDRDYDCELGQFPPTLSYDEFLENCDDYNVIIRIEGR